MQMVISHLKTAPFQWTLFIFFKLETDTARSSVPHYSCKRSVTSLIRGDRMAFSGSIKARERPCTKKSQGEKKGRTEAEQGGRRREKKKNRGGTAGTERRDPEKKKKGKAEESHRSALPLSSSLQKNKRTTLNQRLLTTGITIVYFPSSQN